MWYVVDDNKELLREGNEMAMTVAIGMEWNGMGVEMELEVEWEWNRCGSESGRGSAWGGGMKGGAKVEWNE